jgi:hypothetical protein
MNLLSHMMICRFRSTEENKLIEDSGYGIQDVESADKRLKEYECYDWWFCHKAAAAKK